MTQSRLPAGPSLASPDSMPSVTAGGVYAAMAAHTLISAATYLVMGSVREVFTGYEAAIFRFLLAGLVYAGLLLAMRAPLLPPKHLRTRLLVLGLVALPLNQGLFAIGMGYTTAAHGAILFAMTPACVMIGAAIFLRERISRGKFLGVAVAFVGAVIVLFDTTAPARPPAGATAPASVTAGILGDICVFGSVIAWAAYTILARPAAQSIGAVRTTGYGMVYAAALAVCIGPLVARPLPDLMAPPFAPAWLGIGYLAVVTSVLAYALWAVALRRLEAARVAIFTNLQPVATAVLAFVIFGEAITLPIVIGGVLVIAGITILQRSDRSRKPVTHSRNATDRADERAV